MLATLKEKDKIITETHRQLVLSKETAGPPSSARNKRKRIDQNADSDDDEEEIFRNADSFLGLINWMRTPLKSSLMNKLDLSQLNFKHCQQNRIKS